MAERQFGPYRLVRQVAVGGMAEIYLARVEGADKYVALKMIHPNFAEDDQFIEMLIDEARVSIGLAHPNIAVTYDLGRYGETYYLIMEFVDGADLYKILRRGSERDVTTPIDVAAYVTREVALGLDYAHRKVDDGGRPLQIIHRDVSPQNVIVAVDGAVKLIDFGIAKATSKAQQTAAGVIKGKYYYMSPEQALGEPLDHRTDIFSLGIVLYELLSGQMLYLEEDVHRLLDRVRRADIPPIRTLRRDVPSQLERIVARALARRREERYQSAGDLASDLERFLSAYSPAFTPQRAVAYAQATLGEQAAPMIPTGARRGAARAPVPLPDEISDENSMLFRVDELGPRGKRSSSQPPPRRPPSRGSDQLTAPVGRRGDEDHDEVDSTTVSSRPRAGQTADEPPTSAAGPRGVRRVASARPAPPPRPVPAPVAPPPVSTGFEMGDFEPTVIEEAPPAEHASQRPTTMAAAEPEPELDPDDDGPTFTRDASPMVGVGQIRTPARAGQPAALAAHTPSPAPSQLRRPRESRRTPPGGMGAPSVLKAIVGQPAAPHPQPARGSGAPLSDGVPAALSEPAASTASTGAAGGRGGGVPPRPPVGRGLSLGLQAGSLAPSFDAPTSPGAMVPAGLGGHSLESAPTQVPQPPVPTPMPAPVAQAPWPPSPSSWPGQPAPPQPGAPMAGAPPTGPHGLPGEVPVYPFPLPQPMQLPSISRQLAAIELDEIPPQYRIRRSGPSKALLVALAVVIVFGIGAAVLLVVQGQGKAGPPDASIVIDSSPSGATVVVDGVTLPEKTPTVFRHATPGKRYELELRLTGHKTFKDGVLVGDDGGEVRVAAPLLARTVSLTVVTEPPGGYVSLGGRPKGAALTADGLVLRDLPPDDAVKLQVEYKGQIQSRDLTWPEGTDDQTIRVKFSR